MKYNKWNNASGDYDVRISEANKIVIELTHQIKDTNTKIDAVNQTITSLTRQWNEADQNTRRKGISRAYRNQQIRVRNDRGQDIASKKAELSVLTTRLKNFKSEKEEAEKILKSLIDAKNEELVLEAKNKANEMTAKIALQKSQENIALGEMSLSDADENEGNKKILLYAGIGGSIIVLGIGAFLIFKK
jgi:chromosome segregation ATPase